jgi:prepilin-type processing-associated H-X9-DG protein
VVIAIIGLLIALILPAVMAAREAGRRAECLNHLKQMMLAASSFQTANGHFPPDGPPDKGSDSANPSVCRQVAPHLELLPYIDQVPLYHSINFELACDAGETPQNRTAGATRVAVFLCPSEGSQLLSMRPAPNSYRANRGSAPYTWDDSVLPWGGFGPFQVGYYIRPPMIRDGLAQTAFFSERRLGSGLGAGAFDPARDHWCLGIILKPFPSTDALLATCGKVPSPVQSCNDAGGSWYPDGYGQTAYNHTITPNYRIPACKIDPCPTPEMSSNSGGLFGATSEHPGGVHVAMGDGSVRFARDSIDLRVWHALATRAGGETISGDW